MNCIEELSQQAKEFVNGREVLNVLEDADVVLLGESTHGTQEFYETRSEITRSLIKDRGFRIVLIEAEWPDIFLVNDYICNGKSRFQSAKIALGQIKGFGKHMWQNYVTEELVEWMKEFNRGHNFVSYKSCYLFGMDCQQIYRSLGEIYETLSELDFALCSEIKGRLSFFNGHDQSEQSYAAKTVKGIGSEQIPEILQNILSEFQWHHYDRLKAQFSGERLLDLINLEQNLEIIVNAEEYFRKMHLEPSGSQVSWNTRDQHMAITISKVRSRMKEILNDDVKVAVWAHNSHVGNAVGTMRGGVDFLRNETWNLGQMIKQLEEKSVIIGFDTYHGTVTALSERQSGHTETFSLKPALSDSNEGWMHEICMKRGLEKFMIDLKPFKNLVLNRNYKSVVQGWKLPLEFKVYYKDATVYRESDSKDPISSLKLGTVFKAIRRNFHAHGSRVELEQGGWVDEFISISSVQLRVKPLNFVHANVEDFLQFFRPHRYIGVNYVPDREFESHYSDANMVGQYDIFVFIDLTSALKIIPTSELVSNVSSAPSRITFNKQGLRRLLQEIKALRKHPIVGIKIAFSEKDIHVCHFLITGNDGDYAGGEYHGKLVIPKEYPMAPPAIYFFTPNGRFETGKRICVSFSDYHPELWNPSWGLESVLVGLQSFMQEENPEAVGSIQQSSATRKRLAKNSHEFNLKNPDYVEYFVDSGYNDEVDSEGASDDEPFCRYCREHGGSLVSPCICKGGNQWVHRQCLAKWQYQAILNQSTHPKYQTGIENRCNVCQTEFKIKEFSRESLMINFTGAEVANMIQIGCLLVATEKSSQHNLRLMAQYQDELQLIRNLSHWTKSVFLITRILKDRKDSHDSIVGVNMSRLLQGSELNMVVTQLKSFLGFEISNAKHYIGGPVSPETPYLLLSLKTSKVDQDLMEHLSCSRVVSFHESDVSIWCGELDRLFTRRFFQSAAVLEVRIFWGCAGWDRVQLLGEIARGGWGLTTFEKHSWDSVSTDLWSIVVKKAIVAGKNDFTSKDE